MNKLRVLLVLTSFLICVSAYDEELLRSRCIKENGEKLHISFVSIATKGHINPFIGSAQQLSRLGCKVTIPIPEDKLDWVTPYQEIEPITLPVEADLSVQDRREFTTNSKNMVVVLLQIIAGTRPNSMKKLIFDMVKPSFEYLMEEHLKGNYSPDIIVTEKMAAGYADLAYLIGAEVVVMNPGLLLNFDGSGNFHFIPSLGTNFPLEMNYIQRVVNHLIMPQVFALMSPFILSPAKDLRDALGVTDKLPPYTIAQNYTGLEISQTFFGLDYAQPLSPNHVLVGPVLPLTLKKLPERIESWISSHSDKPIYYMCMGTIATFSAEMIRPLMEAFTDQEYAVIWSFPENQRDTLEGITLPPNVLLEDFVPQRELLLHEKIVAFISHTGASSSNEAVTAGVPIICIPFMGDQFEYCNRLSHFGSAIFLDKLALSVDTIREAMINITSPHYVASAKKLQELAFKTGGAKKVAESILSAHYDGVSHLITNDRFLPWYQSSALDLRFTQFVFVFLLPFILYYFYKLLFLCCFCCCRRRKQAAAPNEKSTTPNKVKTA